VLDRCRIRWGRVLAVVDDKAVVESQPLEWDSHRLVLGAVRDEMAVTGEGNCAPESRTHAGRLVLTALGLGLRPPGARPGALSAALHPDAARRRQRRSRHGADLSGNYAVQGLVSVNRCT